MRTDPAHPQSSPPSAETWFEHGDRLPYTPDTKQLGETSAPYSVFRRMAGTPFTPSTASADVFLPGFPDGSYGWARVEQLLSDRPTSRLYVEYLGQGDSDKPAEYAYSTMERADLVEAHWSALKLTEVTLISFDFSSLVILELLARREERVEAGQPVGPTIKRILIFNGGLYTDGHSHPWFTTPVLRTPFGRMGTWLAQKSLFVFSQLVSVLWSKSYQVTKAEIREVYRAIARRNGVQFLSRGAGFVAEHRKHKQRWNFTRFYEAMHQRTKITIIGSEEDPFEFKQIKKARKRLAKYGADIRTFPGGHLTTSEHPELMAQTINEDLR